MTMIGINEREIPSNFKNNEKSWVKWGPGRDLTLNSPQLKLFNSSRPNDAYMRQ